MSSILDAIMAGGHGAPPQGPPGAGLPPDLLAAISNAAPSGGKGEEPPSFDAGLTKVLNDLHAIIPMATDEQDRQTLMTCLANLQKIKAQEQSEQDGALQGKVSPRYVRKATASGAVGGPGA